MEGTLIGKAFVQRMPGRFDQFELAPGDTVATGPALVLPLRATDAVAGVLVAVRAVGAQPFNNEQLDMMAAFADQAALAWQLASTQRQMRELSILTDRDRIARDLHDHVIQRLFAVGLALQGTIPGHAYPKCSSGSPTASTICRKSFRRSVRRSSICTGRRRESPGSVSAWTKPLHSFQRRISAPRCNTQDPCRWSMRRWPITRKLWCVKR